MLRYSCNCKLSTAFEVIRDVSSPDSWPPVGSPEPAALTSAPKSDPKTWLSTGDVEPEPEGIPLALSTSESLISPAAFAQAPVRGATSNSDGEMREMKSMMAAMMSKLDKVERQNAELKKQAFETSAMETVAAKLNEFADQNTSQRLEEQRRQKCQTEVMSKMMQVKQHII